MSQSTCLHASCAQTEVAQSTCPNAFAYTPRLMALIRADEVSGVDEVSVTGERDRWAFESTHRFCAPRDPPRYQHEERPVWIWQQHGQLLPHVLHARGAPGRAAPPVCLPQARLLQGYSKVAPARLLQRDSSETTPTTSDRDALSSLAVCVVQAVLHIPSSPSEMKEVLYERLSVPLQFLNISYLVTLKVRSPTGDVSTATPIQPFVLVDACIGTRCLHS